MNLLTRTNRTRPLMRILLVTLVVAGVADVAAADGREKEHPGYVDGMAFAALADPEGQLVEVNLRGKLLKLLSTRAVRRQDEGLASILGELVCIQAVIAEIDAKYADVARADIGKVESKLDRDKWERFVRVRDGNEEFTAYVHMDKEDEVDGLVVIGFVDRDELIFVNLVGRIDMERIALLGERLGVPTLDDLPRFEDHRNQDRVR